MMIPQLSVLQVLGAIDGILTGSGYRRIAGNDYRDDARIYEDPYGIVGITSFETVAELLERWREAQQRLVDVISAYIRRDEAKAWDGYLLLFTPDATEFESAPALTAIRRDTARVRKLVWGGESLRTLADVERALIPLLPLQPEGAGAIPVSALELLPDLLASHGVTRETSLRLLQAWDRQSSLIRALRPGDYDAP